MKAIEVLSSIHSEVHEELEESGWGKYKEVK